MGIPVCKINEINSNCFQTCNSSGKNSCLCNDDSKEKKVNVLNNISSGDSSKNVSTNSKSPQNVILNNSIVLPNPQQENEGGKIIIRNKYRNKFFNKINSDNQNPINEITSPGTDENSIANIIKIQTIFRGFLARKKLIKINNSRKIENTSENESENEKCYIEHEDTIIFNVCMNWTNISNISTNSCLETSPKKNSLNSPKEQNLIIPYNLKSKKNIKYYYIGYIKNNSLKKNNSFVSIKHNNKISGNIYIKNGFGKLLFNDKTEFIAIFTNDKSNNYSIYKDHKKKEIFQGMYNNNIPNGFGIYSNILNNIIITGYFKSNGINDIGIEESKDNGYVYYGEFDNNLKHGLGTLQWKDGIIYQGQFNKNQMSGYGIIKFNKNQYYQGQLKEGKMDGYGEFFWENGNRYFGEYKNDKKEGFGVYIWSEYYFNESDNIKDDNLSILNNGSAYVGFWSEGKMNGIGMKINSREIKYGLWKKGVKEKWIEDSNRIRYYVNANQKKYLRILSGTRQQVINLIHSCFARERQEIDLENN